MSKISELSDGGVIQGGDTLIAVRSGGNVKVTYGGTTTANIDGGTIDGTTIGGTTPAAGSFTTGSFTGNVSFGDNDKAIFGTGNDLQIYHSGSHSFISEAGTGDLYIGASNNIALMNAAFSENKLLATTDGALKLYYDGSQKLATTSTGIDVTGSVTADGLTVAATGTPTITIQDQDGTNQRGFLKHGAGNTTITTQNGTSHGQFQVLSYNGTNTINRLNIDSNGDISFYEDTGTTAKLFWDSSAESLNVGSTQLNFSTVKVQTGSATDAAAGFNVFTSATGDGYLLFSDGNVGNQSYSGQVRYNHASDFMAFGTAGGVERMRINSTGIDVTGSVTADGGTIDGALSVNTAGNLLTLNATSGVAYQAFKENGTNRFFLGTLNGSDGLAFIDADGASQRMVIDSSGRVGIGTSPSSILDINTTGSGVNIQAGSAAADIALGIGSPSTANKVVVTAGGSVGIGASSPSSPLAVQSGSAGATVASFKNSGFFGLTITPQVGGSGAVTDIRLGSGESLSFSPSNTEAMRLDSAGNLLVGKGGTNIGAVGVEARNDGQLWATRDGNPVLSLNRETSDGSIAVFYKDATAVGSIGTRSSGLVVGSGDTGLFYDSGGDRIFPESPSGGAARDAAIDLGTSAARFKNLYLSGTGYFGTSVGIGTSSTNQLLSLNSTAAGERGISFDQSGVERVKLLYTNSTGAFVINNTTAGYTSFENNGSEAMRIDSSGQVRLSNTTPVWDLTFSSLVTKGGFTGSQSTSYLYSGQNLYFNNGFKYSASSNATLYEQSFGNHIFYNAPSGTAGNAVSLTQAMTLDTSGNALVGRSSRLTNQTQSISANTVMSVHGVLTSHQSACGVMQYVGDAFQLRAYGASTGTGNIQFLVGGGGGSADSEAMRLDSSGNLQVGHTNSDNSRVSVEAASAGVAMHFRRNTATYTTSAVVGSITCDSVSTGYNTSSDQRLKDNIVDAPSASDDIDAIQVRSFDWKADGSHQKYGMVAQELQSVAPEAVSEGVTEEDMMGVDYSKLVPMMLKEIQSLRARVAQLEGAN